MDGFLALLFLMRAALARGTARRAILKSRRLLARAKIANALDRFGSADGGMSIEIAGEDGAGRPAQATWQVRAGAGDGPYVPVGPAAAMVQRLAFGTPVPAGARSAAGLIGINDILAWYEGLAITVASETSFPGPSLYRRVLGADFDVLPETTRRLHRGAPAILAEGEAMVESVASAPARLLSRWLGMPVRSGKVAVRVVIEQRQGREYWSRSFAGKVMRSEMREECGLIAERFGPFSIRMRLLAHGAGLDMRRVDGRFLGLPIPAFLLPQITAEERVDMKGKHLFNVEIGVPLLGRLVAYRGHLLL